MLDENAAHAQTLLDQLNNQGAAPAYTPEGVAPTVAMAGPQSFEGQAPVAPPVTPPVAVAPPAPQMQAPPAPAPQLPDGMITNPYDLASAQAKTQNQAIAYNYQDGATAKRDLASQAKLEAQQAAADAPAAQKLAQQTEASNARFEANSIAIQKQMDTSIAHYQSVQAEMAKMAAQEPQDLLGAAGVNRMGGFVSIFLGGLNRSQTGGRNANLEQIQNMAEHNIAAQKNRYEMLNRVGMGDNTMFGMLQNKLQDSQAAETTLKNGYLEAYKNQLLASAAQFRNPQILEKAKAQAHQIDGQIHQNNLKAHEAYQAQAGQSIALAQQARILSLKDAHAEHKDMIDEQKLLLEGKKFDTQEADKENEGHIKGYIGRFSKPAHAQVAKVTDGARNIVSSLNDIKKAVEGGLHTGNVRDFNTAKTLAFAAARIFLQTGQRLEGPEVTQVKQISMDEYDVILGMLQKSTTSTDLLEVMRKIENTQALVTKSAFNTAQTYAPHIKFDPSDSLTGRFDPNTYKSQTDIEDEKARGTQQGRKELADLPAYTGGGF